MTGFWQVVLCAFSKKRFAVLLMIIVTEARDFIVSASPGNLPVVWLNKERRYEEYLCALVHGSGNE